MNERNQPIETDALNDEQTLRQSAESVAAAVELSRAPVEHDAGAPKVSGYAAVEKLGEGAYGQVWRAVQKRTNKQVALKIFTQRAGLDWIFLQREVERLTRLDRHPHIVTLLDTDLENEPPFYVMDLIEAGSLDQFVGDDPPPLERVIRWMKQICEALVYVHGKGLIHCDLKPANVLVDEQNNVRVVDFGQSRVFTESAASLGTLYYMAPEQAQLATPGNPIHPDVRWDVYALGATVYAMLTGGPPRATTESRRTLQTATDLSDRLTRYRQVVESGANDVAQAMRNHKYGDFGAVLVKCLAPNPDDRYEAVAEVLADLEAVEEQRPVSPLAHNRIYRFRKFVQRNPFKIGLGVSMLILLPSLYVASARQSQRNEALARDILAAFVYSPKQAYQVATKIDRDIQHHLRERTVEALSSPAFTHRIMGGRAGLVVDPDAFWSSVDGGALWQYGEWLEVLHASWPDAEFLRDQLLDRAASGTERQKYVAFCLLGELASPNNVLASFGDAVGELAASAAGSENHPGVVSAAAWAARRLGHTAKLTRNDRVFVDDISGLTFMKVPGEESYRRGASPGDRDQGHDERRLADGVAVESSYFSMTEIPVAVLERFVNSTASDGMDHWGTPELPSIRDYLREAYNGLPVTDKDRFGASLLSLEAARALCAWLNAEADGATPSRTYRLPNESEWEHACRGGNPGRFCFGDDAKYAPYFAACNGIVSRFHILGQRMPNFYGLHDMHGGLWEICDARYEDEFVFEPQFQGRTFYVRKGGGYYGPAIRCRTTQRDLAEATGEGPYMGVRLVMELQ